MAAEDNASIERAMKNLAAAVPRVERDPSRPRYHLQPPALWNNDPNGLIFHKGYYHVFYQFNPYGDVWGNIHWGHARSTDLTHWEHLPIALWPSREQGEEHCFSGCTVIDDQGRPMVFYTSVGPQKHPRDSADQWAAIGDNDLIRWTKHPANPILTQALHGGLKILEWRDPFVFREEGRWLMVLGGHRAQGSGCICLYESPDLLDWRFLGIPIEGTEPNWECPSLFRLRDKWILIYSPHGPVRYYTGQLDLTRCRFTPDFHGTLDHSEQFYAANSLCDRRGRRILWGWVRGFQAGRGWNGCLSLPRQLDLGPNGRLRQRPAPELETLRCTHVQLGPFRLDDASLVVDQVRGDGLEILVAFRSAGARQYGLRVRRSEDGRRAVPIRVHQQELEVGGAWAPLAMLEDEATLRLHVFLDKSVLEVYANRRVCLTRVIDAGADHLGLELFASGGAVHVQELDVWHIPSD